MSNREVARAFWERRPASARNLYTDGTIIYSYGPHWPLAAWHRGRVLLCHVSRSVSTNRHAALVRAAFIGAGPIEVLHVLDLRGNVAELQARIAAERLRIVRATKHYAEYHLEILERQLAEYLELTR